MKKTIIANWKMELTLKQSVSLAKKMVTKFKGFSANNVVICPGFVSLEEVSNTLKKTNISLGAQDVAGEEKGAYTGEVSINSLKQVKCKYVIIGHSERRKYFSDDKFVNDKTKEVLSNSNMIPIVCIGESLKERKAGKTNSLLAKQLKKAFKGIKIKKNQKIIVAYEPVWAIGTGKVIKTEDIVKANKKIRDILLKIFSKIIVDNNIDIVYGGSVNEKNAKDFSNLENLDGFLVGGASLNHNKFFTIANSI